MIRAIRYSNIWRVFGQPCNKVNLVKINIPLLGLQTVNIKLSKQFYDCFQELEESGLGGLIKSCGGIYNCRKIKLRSGGFGNPMSTHAWGISVDLNSAEFPFPDYSNKDQVKSLIEHMLRWGFHRPNRFDKHHFQFYKFVEKDIIKLDEDNQEEEMAQKVLERIDDKNWLHQNAFKKSIFEDERSTVFFLTNYSDFDSTVVLRFYDRDTGEPIKNNEEDFFIRKILKPLQTPRIKLEKVKEIPDDWIGIVKVESDQPLIVGYKEI